jgi:hypothetical protein
VGLKLEQITEHTRGPNTPYPYALVDGQIVEEPTLVVKSKQASEAFRKKLLQQLALTPRKEIFIYIHGYHNTFDDAAFAMAELWHFIGRVGVPIIYTWPAGYPGLFGYTYDRESSEFTVFHLRKVLKFIGKFPEIDKVHLRVLIFSSKKKHIQRRPAMSEPTIAPYFPFRRIKIADQHVSDLFIFNNALERTEPGN